MSFLVPTYLVDKTGVPIDGTNPLPTSGSGGGTVDQGASNADATDGWSTRLTDGSAFITPAKTGQFPTTLGATTAASSLGVGIATDQLATLATQTTASAMLAQLDAKTSTLATATKQDTGNTSLATIATTQTDGNQKTQVTSSALPTGAATAAKQPALGTAGTPSTDVLSVQGVAGGIAQPISAAALPLPSGAATSTLQGAGLPAALVGGKLDVNLGTSSITLPISAASNLPVSQATASSLNAQVVGTVAAGAAISGNPVQVGGSDGTLVRAIRTNTSGNLAITGAGTAGSAVTTTPVQVGGSDGTNLRDLATDTSGRLKAAGASGFSYITSATTTTVKSSAGVLRGVFITAHWSAGSFTVYNDNGGTSNPIAGFDANITGFFPFNVVCGTGITVVTGAGFNGQTTVVYD